MYFLAVYVIAGRVVDRELNSMCTEKQKMKLKTRLMLPREGTLGR